MNRRKPIKVRVIVLGARGILTPHLCQVCKQGGSGIVSVRGLNGRYFSAHRWPCAEREGLKIEEPA